MRGPNSCQCCGAVESTSGCVRGLRCGCDHAEECRLCMHCIKHHATNCTGALRAAIAEIEHEASISVMQQIGEMRIRYNINVFEIVRGN